MSKVTFYGKLLFTTISWGLTFVGIKYLLEVFQPFFFVFLRFLLTLVFILMILVYKQVTKNESMRVAGKDLWKMLLLGIGGIGLAQVCLTIGVKLSNASSGALIMSVSPIMTVVLSSVFGQEKLSSKKIIGTLLGFIGIVMCLNPFAVSGIFEKVAFNGKVLLCIAAIFWAMYSILGKSLLRKYRPSVVTFYAFCGGVLVLLPFGFSSSQWMNCMELRAQDWMIMIFLSLGAGAIGYMFWYDAIRVADTGRVVIFMNIVPLAGTLCSVVFLKESLSFFFLIGMLMVVGGITLVAGYDPRKAECPVLLNENKERILL